MPTQHESYTTDGKSCQLQKVVNENSAMAGTITL